MNLRPYTRYLLSVGLLFAVLGPGMIRPALALVTFVNPQTTQINSSNSVLSGVAVAGSDVTLTNDNGAAGAVWFDTQLAVQNFSVTFEARITKPVSSFGHSNGLAFAIHNSAAGTAALGAPGGHGYGGISNSAAVIFDTYLSNEIGVGIGGGGFDSSGVVYDLAPRSLWYAPDGVSTPPPETQTSIEFDDGVWHTFRIDYESAATDLGVYVDGIFVLLADIDLSAALNGPSGYLGITAGTGDFFYSTHEVRSFALTTEEASAIAMSAPGGVLLFLFALLAIVFRTRIVLATG